MYPYIFPTFHNVGTNFSEVSHASSVAPDIHKFGDCRLEIYRKVGWKTDDRELYPEKAVAETGVSKLLSHSKFREISFPSACKIVDALLITLYTVRYCVQRIVDFNVFELMNINSRGFNLHPPVGRWKAGSRREKYRTQLKLFGEK